MIYKWITATEHKETVRILLVDFFKAYDLVCQNVLVNKLTKCNVPDNLVPWVCVFLQDHEQRVKIRNDIECT